ncbi:MAG: SUF system Fe-S cluster assembly regulator [Mariprofundaceae bacterium]|nr:SUF system Fe-S cluster assembly regulator [Mariprofundaceae bacterium]
MLRLTRVTDYGILLMTKLAKRAAEDASARLTSSSLALATRVPAPTVSKILQTLLHAGLLNSERGAHGGYCLVRPASNITLREIIHCLEGSIALTECNLEKNECEQMPFCSTSNHWKRINAAIHHALEGITLEDMTSEAFTPVFVMKKTMPIQTEPIQIKPIAKPVEREAV